MFIVRNKTEISQKRTFMIIFQKIIETVQKEFENLLSRSLQNQIRKNKNNLQMKTEKEIQRKNKKHKNGQISRYCLYV